MTVETRDIQKPKVITPDNAIDNMNIGYRERELLKLAISGAGVENENTGDQVRMWIGTQEELDKLEQQQGVLYLVVE